MRLKLYIVVSALFFAYTNNFAQNSRYQFSRLNISNGLSHNHGETKTVELDVKVGDLAFYDETRKEWNTEAGEYVLQLDNFSSRNITQKVKISVK